MADYRLYKHTSTGVLPWGGGTAYDTSGLAVRKLYNIGVEFENRSNDNDIFIPANSTEEKRAVHNFLGNVSGVLTYRGNFIDNEGFLRKDKFVDGNYCWGGSNWNSDFDTTVPGCDAGWSDPGAASYSTRGPMPGSLGDGTHTTYVTGVDSSTNADSDITGAYYPVYLSVSDVTPTNSFTGAGGVNTMTAVDYRLQGSPSLQTTYDDGSVRIPCSGFSFFGVPYDYCYVNSNGSITFHRPFTGWISDINKVNSPRQPSIIWRGSTSTSNDLDGMTLGASGTGATSTLYYKAVTGGVNIILGWQRHNDNSRRGLASIFLTGNKVEVFYESVNDTEWRFAVAPGITGNISGTLTNYGNSPASFPYDTGNLGGNSSYTIAITTSNPNNVHAGTTNTRVYWASAYAKGYYNYCSPGFNWYRNQVRICKRGGNGMLSSSAGNDLWNGYVVP